MEVRKKQKDIYTKSNQYGNLENTICWKAPILSPTPHRVGQGKVGKCMGEQKDKLSVLCEITLAGEIVILGTDSTLDFHDTSQWRLQVRS